MNEGLDKVAEKSHCKSKTVMSGDNTLPSSLHDPSISPCHLLDKNTVGASKHDNQLKIINQDIVDKTRDEIHSVHINTKCRGGLPMRKVRAVTISSRYTRALRLTCSSTENV